MKNRVVFLLVFLLLTSCFVFEGNLSVSAANYPAPASLDGTENLFLSYTFNYSYPASGHRTREGYHPLVGYHNAAGTCTDIFFDSFLFLPCVTTTPSGGRTYRDNNNPSNFSDWQMYVDDVFLDNYNVDALNDAVGDIKAELGSAYSDFKANIFLTVLYPVKTQTNFGDVDGDGISENFSTLANRKKAIKWIIDEQTTRFNNGNYSNLNLVGFYWFEENFNSTDSQENSIITYMNSYAHSLDFKTLWIPYYNATGYSSWASYGFDVASYQPNYMFNSTATSSRVTTACDTAKNYNMGVEIEAEGSVLTSVTSYNKYMDYMRLCKIKGANQGIKTYYNDAVNGVFYDAYVSSNSYARKVYDITYKYASQTLQTSDIVYLDSLDKYVNYNIVSDGCSYTTTTPYTNTTAGYGDVSGTELTDNVFGTTNYGSDWVAFHISLTEPDGFYYINLDLGSVNNNLSLFSLELNDLLSAGISLPDSVEFLISTNGTDYTSLGYAEIMTSLLSHPLAKIDLKDKVSARYIRAKIEPGIRNFVFVSEFSVGEPVSTRYGGTTYANIASGCSYTASQPYTDSTNDYSCLSYTELTNGAYGSSLVGNEWHAFHVSHAINGTYSVVIDLGKSYSQITRFGIEFEEKTSYSIGLPDSVKFYGSADGVNYTLYGEVTPVWSGNQYYIYDTILDTTSKTARYIKAVFDTGDHNFVFASEFFVGVPY